MITCLYANYEAKASRLLAKLCTKTERRSPTSIMPRRAVSPCSQCFG